MIISGTLFIIVLVHSTVPSLQFKLSKDTNGSVVYRRKRDDRWIWSSDDTTSHRPRIRDESIDDRQNNQPIPANTTEEYNPCGHLGPLSKPDFRAPGRRISEVMCYDYIWEIKEEQDAAKRTQACHEYLQKNAVGVGFGVGGRNANPGEFPHMGAIGWKGISQDWVFKCGGSVISHKFVLTAAHCSKASSLNSDISDTVPRIVRLGQTKIYGFTSISKVYSQDAYIIRIIVHPNYVSPYKYFDIALMEVKHDITFFGPIQPACLWTQKDPSRLGTSVSITGWGVTEAGSRQTSPDLQAVDLDLIDSQYCNYLLEEQHLKIRHWYGLQDHQLCAGKLAGGADACQGDSGGPLQVQIPLPENSKINIYYVIGITSFGIGCALPNIPGIYTRVSSFIDWIESVVWPAYK